MSLAVIQRYMSSFNAAQAAEIFLSPHIAPELLLGATAEPGPSMWIVNRSDVFDGTLEMMQHHSIPEMARRAAEKLMKRRHPHSTLIPPAMEMQISEIHDSSVEDILGHPLAPWDAIYFFATVPNPAHRASAALSLTRRLLEFPPNHDDSTKWLAKLKLVYAERLLSDTSTYVRSYAARIPFWDADVLQEAMRGENDAAVMGRLLQHPAIPKTEIENALTDRSRLVFDNGHVQTIAALDARVDRDLRQSIPNQIADPENFIRNIHEWYLLHPN